MIYLHIYALRSLEKNDEITGDMFFTLEKLICIIYQQSQKHRSLKKLFFFLHSILFKQNSAIGDKIRIIQLNLS